MPRCRYARRMCQRAADQGRGSAERHQGDAQLHAARAVAGSSLFPAAEDVCGLSRRRRTREGQGRIRSVLRRLPRLEVRRRLRHYSVRSLCEGAGRDDSLRPRDGPGGADAIGPGDLAKQAGRGKHFQVVQRLRHRLRQPSRGSRIRRTLVAERRQTSARCFPSHGAAAIFSEGERYSDRYAASAARRDSARSTIGAG